MTAFIFVDVSITFKMMEFMFMSTVTSHVAKLSTGPLLNATSVSVYSFQPTNVKNFVWQLNKVNIIMVKIFLDYPNIDRMILILLILFIYRPTEHFR